jgi:hypothetical protein
MHYSCGPISSFILSFSPSDEQQFQLDSNPQFNIEKFGVLLTLPQPLAYLPQTFNYILNCVSLHLFCQDLTPRCVDQQFSALSNALLLQVNFFSFFFFFSLC